MPLPDRASAGERHVADGTRVIDKTGGNGYSPARFNACPLRLSARTPGSHPGKRGSTPLGGAIPHKQRKAPIKASLYGSSGKVGRDWCQRQVPTCPPVSGVFEPVFRVEAVGILQMWPCAVEEANRLAGRDLWTLEDRRNPQLSWAMAWQILEHHYLRGHTDVVSLACRWHTPYGEAPESYVEKVRSVVGQI